MSFSYKLYCPACGEQVPPGPNTCEHVEFIRTSVEPGDFEFISDRFSDQAEVILNKISDLEKMEDEDQLSIVTHLHSIKISDHSLIVSVVSKDCDTYFSDLAYFGFNFE